MAMPSSQTMNCTCAQLCDIVRAINGEMVPKLRPVMPVDLFKATINGDNSKYIDGLIRRLEVQPKEQRGKLVNIEDSDSVKSELQSATLFGDTILHLLITAKHNELALKVSQCDKSLLKAQNNTLETPLCCAVKVGNTDVIVKHMKSNCADVEDVVTALHVAIIEGSTEMVLKMLEVDPNLAYIPFSDGMVPIHKAALMGHLDQVKHFMQKFPQYAELRDRQGRNFFHIAAEENQEEIFSGVFKDASFKEMKERMNTAKNYQGNTPFHIAAKKGNREIMKAIWIYSYHAENIPNKQGYTPFKLSTMQLKTNKDFDNDLIDEYVKNEGEFFSNKWFDEVMEPPLENKWDRTQVIGLGSVLITTVAFAASFTMPGGYNQDNGTPVLGRRYMFRAFVLANALAFIEGFLSLLALLTETLRDLSDNSLVFATMSFVVAASSMVVAFGLGMYVTLAPVCLPIAILLLVSTLFLGTPPAMLYCVGQLKSILGPTMNPNSDNGPLYILAFSVMSFLLIFGLAFV